MHGDMASEWRTQELLMKQLVSNGRKRCHFKVFPVSLVKTNPRTYEESLTSQVYYPAAAGVSQGMQRYQKDDGTR